MEKRLIAVPDHAAEVLASELRSIGAGAKVPSERALAAQLGISRGAVREALRILEGDGRVVKVPGHGRFTSEPGPSAAPIRAWLDAHGRELQEACEVGAVLQWRAVQTLTEPEAQALAVELGEILRRAERALAKQRVAELAALDTAFHLTLVSRCRNAALRTLVEELTTSSTASAEGTYSVPDVAAHSLDQHHEIVDALAAGDAAVAAHLVMAHLFSTMRFAQRAAGPRRRT